MITTIEPQPPDRKLVAPLRHTVVLIVIFAALTVAGAALQKQLHSGLLKRRPNVVPLYLSLIVSEWALVYYVWKGGLRQSGGQLRDLIGGTWGSGKKVLIDLALGFGLWLLWLGLRTIWRLWLGPGHAPSIDPLLPQGVIEALLWAAVSVTAGFCEEVVFRGYFLRQFQVLTGSSAIAVLLQAVLFGVSHGYQGMDAAIKITVYGVLFGLLALWRKSLRPGMVAHAWSDIFAGILSKSG